MIVRNEADHLRRCLASVRPLCDQIVVVDTGSSDDSASVAAGFGASVLHRPWDADFSAARNLALDHLQTTWVLYIDADEEIRDTEIAGVRRTLASSTGVAAYRVKFATRLGWTPYREYRLWRHRSDVRYTGRIHESMLGDLRRIVREEGQRFADIDLFIQHYGYEGDQTAKHLRNLPLLEQQVVTTPRRVYLWNHLARVYEALGRHDDATAAIDRGIAIVREYGLQEPVDIQVFGTKAFSLLFHGEDAREIIDEGLALRPDFYTLHAADAYQRLRDGDWLGAERAARGLIATGTSDVLHPVVAYSTAIFDRLPWELLGEALFEQGRLAEAAAAYETAAVNGSDPLEMRVKAAVCRKIDSHDQPLGT